MHFYFKISDLIYINAFKAIKIFFRIIYELLEVIAVIIICHHILL